MRTSTAAWLPFVAALLPAQAAPPPRYAPPAFAETERRARVEALLPELDGMFAALAEKEHLPALVWGIVLDGALVHAHTQGLADVERGIAAGRDTRFRIASMTKSFVCMAALRLRDAGKLDLDDPVRKHVPEFAAVELPTEDAPPVTVGNLMTMTAGLPEDNPWGDRQMAISAEAIARMVGGGLSFSNPPGEVFEYSNLGYVLLGRVVTVVSGVRCQDYVTEHILRPLGMHDTVWEYTLVPEGKFARGYRWEHGAWQLEPVLPDGDGAAMGGLITTLEDHARYVAFHLAAWPSRDGADDGPVRRATVREMHLPRVWSGAAPRATLLDGKTPNPTVSFYGYGLGWSRDSRGVVKVAHSGGLPGYGSIHRFCPDHGIGVIAFSNLRYGPVYDTAGRALDLLLERGGLRPRAVAVSAVLLQRREQVAAMVRSWDPDLVAAVTADNFLLDRSLADWRTAAQECFAAIGDVQEIGPLAPQNQLRGSFEIRGAKGRLRVGFTLSPEREPKVQQLQLTVVEPK